MDLPGRVKHAVLLGCEDAVSRLGRSACHVRFMAEEEADAKSRLGAVSTDPAGAAPAHRKCSDISAVHGFRPTFSSREATR